MVFSALQYTRLFWPMENRAVLTETPKTPLNGLIVITDYRFLGMEAGVDRHGEAGFGAAQFPGLV